MIKDKFTLKPEYNYIVIIVAAGIFIAVILVFGYESFRSTKKATLEEFNHKQLIIADGAKNGIEIYFNNLADNLRALSLIPEVQSFDEEITRKELTHTFNRIKSVGVNDMGVLNADGIVKFSVIARHLEGKDFSWRKYYKELKKSDARKDYVIEFIEFKGFDAGNKGILMALPMYRQIMKGVSENHKLIGIIVCILYVDKLTQKFVAPIKPSNRGHAFLLDREYNILWSPDSSWFGKNLLGASKEFPAFQQLLKAIDGKQASKSAFSFYRFDDQETKYVKSSEKKLIALSPVNIGDTWLVIGVWAPENDALQLVQSAYLKQLLLTGVASLTIIIGASLTLLYSAAINRQLQEEIVKLKAVEERLYYLSHTDALTDLHNRRSFLSLANQQMKVAKREKRGMYLMFVDLDKMKWINDQLGHSVGDSALRDVAGILKMSFRESDIVARVGGDEFIVVTMESPDINIDSLAQRINSALDTYNAKKDKPFVLSLSIGIVRFDPDNPRSIEKLITEADRLMYENKKSKKIRPS